MAVGYIPIGRASASGRNPQGRWDGQREGHHQLGAGADVLQPRRRVSCIPTSGSKRRDPFIQALRLDPNIAMAYVGLSRVSTGLEDAPPALGAINRAKTLAAAGHASEWETKRIAIRAMQVDCLANLGDFVKHQAYKKLMDEALASNPRTWNYGCCAATPRRPRPQDAGSAEASPRLRFTMPCSHAIP